MKACATADKQGVLEGARSSAEGKNVPARSDPIEVNRSGLTAALGSFDPGIELAATLDSAGARGFWPGLDREDIRNLSIRVARDNGLFERLGRRLAEGDPSLLHHERKGVVSGRKRPTLKAFLKDRPLGPGSHADKDWYNATICTLQDETLAVWLGHPSADEARVLGLVEEICGMEHWVSNASRTWRTPGHPVDITSSKIGLALADATCLIPDVFGDRRLREVRAMIGSRVLDAATDWRSVPLWNFRRSNWNHVCLANVLLTGLALLDDSDGRAGWMLHCLHAMEFGLSAFSGDGGCVEGPDYWIFGFGHFLMAATAVFHLTGGSLSLLDHPVAAAAVGYPHVAWIEKDLRVPFGDALPTGPVPSLIAQMVRFLRESDALFPYVGRTADGRPVLDTWRELALAVSVGLPGAGKGLAADPSPRFLQGIGLGRLSHESKGRRVDVAVTAFHNGVPHNHNDLGSFICIINGEMILADPGQPYYNERVFGPRRYEDPVCGSHGHSVPEINGHRQGTGSEFFARLELDRPSNIFRAALAKAYADPTLLAFDREWHLDDGGCLRISDRFRFTCRPHSIEEVFVSFHPMEPSESPSAVRVLGKTGPHRLHAETAGSFRIERIEVAVVRRGVCPLWRAVFSPVLDGPEIDCRFALV